MKMNNIKISVITAASLMFSAAIFLGGHVGATVPASPDEAATYKTKCAACHTAAASKFFDPAKADEELVQIILKGKKGEKPPFMPGFEAKGMTEDEAKSLTTFMKSLRTPTN